METADGNQSFPRVLVAWKTIALAVGSVLVIGLSISLAETALHSLSGRGNEIGYLGWTLFFTIVWGGGGIGGTYLYLRVAELDDSFCVNPPDKTATRLLGVLLVFIVTMFAAGAAGIWFDLVPARSFGFLTFAVDALPGSTLKSWPSYLKGLIFTMVLLGAFVGPAVAALTHGVLQNAVRDVASPGAGVLLAAGLLATYTAARTSGTASVGLFIVVLLIGCVTGLTYERTKNLLVPMITYGVASALGLLAISLPMIFDLYSEFGTSLP